jgi:hypothetical protein
MQGPTKAGIILSCPPPLNPHEQRLCGFFDVQERSFRNRMEMTGSGSKLSANCPPEFRDFYFP